MKSSKRIFLFVFIVFMLIVFFFIYDFSRRTTFPGKKAGSVEQKDR